MFRITVDVYSGRPNPVIEISNDDEIRSTLRQLSANRSLATAEPPAEGGLGLRGFQLEIMDDELARRYDLAGSLYIPAGAATAEFTERLTSLAMSGNALAVPGFEEQTTFDEGLRDYLLGQLERSSSGTVQEGSDKQEPATADAVCYYDFYAFNPGFWNDNSTTLWNNNCYNYASNWRTNTFAQPGRGCGNVWKAITAAEVTRAALCDGMHRRYDCFPDTEKPRNLVALVIAPGPAFIDYHWYRYHQGGFWGHKPGGTAARNVDNSNQTITNPETADRGPYTIFAGYFYGCDSQRRRIR
ncbi:hypothetical protein JIG36_23620 [Actinoplanes sp. LDG1-06]|uniref:Uncharacterized protein n=1 Tax=Paractinoplanes ovalisporus TaxID=2810368 RepID=A0ABS2AFF8_9ACTN|nr:hypothetical protein [Actinoplanes ovalisporus]MBM2618549.1 hypothetical protein [Actinoplanes ovalisporus]